MPSPKVFESLTRLFKRKRGGDLVEMLHARALNTPLALHSDLGAAMIEAWLRPENASVLDLKSEAGAESGLLQRVKSESGTVTAVLDISGALVSRPVGMCSPLSYVEIREAFMQALNDDSISHIVLRIDSPGGEVAGLFDLADTIYQARDQKPITAVVDDMACSAAFAIASSAHQVLLSRTGVVGSVGVVSYHIDQSAYNARAGVKVEYIFAGEHKVDGNPNAPLAHDARERFQSEVDELYEMFVQMVARNRNLDAKAVRATEAGTFRGQKAVEMGFADSVVAFADFMTQHLETGKGWQSNPIEQAEMTQQDIRPQATDEANDDNEAQQLEAEANEAAPVAEPEAKASDKAAQASLIRALCAAAGVADAAEDFISAGRSVEQVRADLMDLAATDGPEIQTARASDTVSGESAYHIDPANIYRKRNGG